MMSAEQSTDFYFGVESNSLPFTPNLEPDFMNNLKSVLDNLKSEKIKERQEALVSIKEVFSQDRVISRFHLNREGQSEPKVWLPVFQALFTTVKNEKLAMTKKSTAKSGTSTNAAQRRLSDAASVVRWLTERTVSYMNKKVVMAVFQHLTQMLSSESNIQGRLFTPVALDYAKALKTLVSHPPHLEHIEDSMWVRIVELSFNVVLEDPINATFALDMPSLEPADDADSDMYMDDGTAEEVDNDYANPSTAQGSSKKRLRHDPSPTPILSPRKAKLQFGSKRNAVISVSLEQVEFASILSIMIGSPVAPILSETYHGLPTGILKRLERFLERYPADSSLLQDYLSILSSTLDHLSLNNKEGVEKFARSTWTGLVGLWGTKDRRMKEGLIVVLRTLYQYIICPSFAEHEKPSHFDCAAAVSELWHLLDAEAEVRWGLDGLVLDSLRLQIMEKQTSSENAFVAKTFCAGWNFTSDQALSWAVLELQADCICTLYQLSESMHPSAVGSSPFASKRRKLESRAPLNSLIMSIQATCLPHVKNYRLQTLLFFIDRHWPEVHDALKQDIVNVLLQYVSFDDPNVQSWVFLNLAAIAHAEGSASGKPHKPSGLSDPNIWDSIWAHSVRRANVPAICRAACHAAQLLLAFFHSQSLLQLPLTSHRVLIEIETLTKDIDVQGPTYPFDSVCIFLSRCLTIASQDVRLYRMHLEDKTLSWFVDTWNMSGNKGKMVAHTMQDILCLLETICALSKRVDLIAYPILPPSEIVNSVIEENKVKIIRHYVLFAKLPALRERPDLLDNPDATLKDTGKPEKVDRSQLAAPHGRERKVSSFFSKSLESLIVELESGKDNHSSAESVRQSLDLAITAIIFESALVLNGIASNRLVLQSAGKVICALSPLITNARWTVTEKLLIAHTFGILIHEELDPHNDAFRVALSSPGPGSGIKEKILQDLHLEKLLLEKRTAGSRLDFLRIVWQNSDVKEALGLAMKALFGVLEQSLNGSLSDTRQAHEHEDRDGFGPIRITSLQSTATNVQNADDKRPTENLLYLCISILACGPFLQSPSAEPTRDKDLMSSIIGSARIHSDKFSLAFPIYLGRIRQGVIQLTIKQVDVFMDEFGILLEQYTFSRNELFHRLLLDMLCSILGIWKTKDSKSIEVHEKFCQLCNWLSSAYKNGKLRSWSLRDEFARFLEKHLKEDPTQDWESFGKDCLPSSLLPMLNSDADIRVRFRVALLNTHLFTFSKSTDQPPIYIYDNLRKQFTIHLYDYEHMLTRMLALGNIMIVNSHVRRGPYWHLIETCFEGSAMYSQHIESIVLGVSQRLGLHSLSSLFEAYAPSLAYTILNSQKDQDFLMLPPHLLGYRDKKHCAEATFRAFTPTYILLGKTTRFEMHCLAIQKFETEGLQDCFGDVVGFQILERINSSAPTDNLEDDIKSKMKISTFHTVFSQVFLQNVDAIVIKILCSLGDQNFSENGEIVPELQNFDSSGKTTKAFQSLTAYRDADVFETHVPNLPAYSTKTIIESLNWLSSRFPDSFTKATTYHVLQGLTKSIHQTPLVNEQYRLLTAMSLWMAIREQDFEDITLLQTVIHGATLFFSQSDLARAAQSILEWAFRFYRKSSFLKDDRLSNILIRICYTAHGYASDVRISLISEMGQKMLNWVDQQAYALSLVPHLQPLIVRALPFWPRPPSTQLLPLHNEITTQNLLSVLEDPRITSNKFRLVRRFSNHVTEHDHDEDQFSRTTFWRLKESIPPANGVEDDDVVAFSELILRNHGRISSFNVEQQHLNTPRNRHARLYKKRGSGHDTFAARDAISLGLLLMLEGDDPSQVYNAYHTLRLVMAIITPTDPRLQTSSEYHMTLEYIKTYHRAPVTRSAVDVIHFLRSDIYIDSGNDFKKWISLITVLLSDALSNIDPFFGQLSSILSSDTDFAEQILPILVHTLLQSEKTSSTEPAVLSLREALSNYFTALLSTKNTDIACIRSIVDTILHLRYFSHRTNDALAYNKWLSIDFTLLARSAILFGAYTTALLFVELASESERQIYEQIMSMEQVLYEIYSHIDEPDGFYGIKSKDLHHFLIKRFHHEQQWDKAFRFHAAALEAGNSHNGSEEGLLQSFHSFGFDHLAMDTLRHYSGVDLDPTPSSMNYRLGWRTETWDLPDQTLATNNSAPLYRSLRAIYRERDHRILDSTIQSALYSEMSHLRTLGSENLAEIRTVSRELMCLSEIFRWRQPNVQNILKPENMELNRWTKFVEIDADFGFADLESLMATRISLIRSVRQREERLQIGSLITPFVKGLTNIEKCCLLRLSEAARSSGQIQIALNSVIRAQGLDKEPTSEVTEEFANVLWLQKEERLAVEFLQELVNRFDDNVSNLPQRALWLSRLGSWTSEACLENPTVIWERYYSPSISLLDQVMEENHRSDVIPATVYRECAIFAERQYHSILKSPDAIRWKVYVDRKKQEIEQRKVELIRSQSNASRHNELRIDQDRAQKLLNEDSELFKKHNTLRETLLRQAIDMHSRCLQISSNFDNDSGIRFCSLWFSNFDDESILDCIKRAIDRIPSRKLVFLAHQLTARVSKPAFSTIPENQENLQRLVLRMCQEHPFHTLYQIYCLSDHPQTAVDRRTSGRLSMQSTQTERGAAATTILDRLRNDPVTGSRIRDVETLCGAYVEWAKYPISKDPKYKAKTTKGYDVPKQLKLLSIQNLPVPVSTAHTPIDPTMQYNDCVTIVGYLTTFDTAGGISLPKISKCKGSDGQIYKQLFKGEGQDDLRQDAVMEQVFELVNGLLKRDRETRRRKLKVRDYKVIPLSSQAGMLEFVGNTLPLRDWLVRAHLLYRPRDAKPNDVMGRMKDYQKKYASNPDKVLEMFLDVRKTFKPVMRHYFTEKHKTPISWFQMRLCYSRSIATTSIVGHVLGLGDRHVSNILLDNGSGEVVHIDLGIAFEQGKLLTIPERVPFRMTADIVDGMGPSGTSGVFQRCSEETLRVLREGSEVIMTVLEVFKHDPLHSWTASELKVKQAQSEVPNTPTTSVNDTSRFNFGIGIDMSSGSADEAADRALTSVARKLDKSLSVESTVNELIAEATDPMNLATIFYGWSPHL